MEHAMKSLQLLVVAVVAAAAFSHRAVAQTPINAPGAMQPSTGTGIIHEMPMYREIGSDPTSGILDGREYIALTQIAYGWRNNVSFQFDAPVVARDLNVTPSSNVDDDEFGLGD